MTIAHTTHGAALIALLLAGFDPIAIAKTAASESGAYASKGAVTVTGDSLQESADPRPGASGANVIIFRDRAKPTIWPATVKIDGKKITSLKDHQYTELKLDPGSHNIAISWSALSGQSGFKGDITIGNEQAYYIGIAGTVDVSGLAYVGAGNVGLSFKVGSQVYTLPAEQGRAIVDACCKYIAQH